MPRKADYVRFRLSDLLLLMTAACLAFAWTRIAIVANKPLPIRILFGLIATAGFAAPLVLAWQFTVLRRVRRISLREFGWLLLGVVEILLLMVGLANILGHGEAAIARVPMIVIVVSIPWVVALSIGITLVPRLAPKPPSPRPWSDRMGSIVLTGNLLLGCVSAPLFRVHEQLSDFSWGRFVP